jgi:hypothetical protein
MPDNWSFVIAAYGLAAVVLTIYWRALNKRERESIPRRTQTRTEPRGSLPAHPRPNPGSTSPLQ